EALAAADALRIQVHVLDASTDDEFNMAFAALANARAGGLVVAIDASFDSQRDKLVALSSEHRIATIRERRPRCKRGRRPAAHYFVKSYLSAWRQRTNAAPSPWGPRCSPPSHR